MTGGTHDETAGQAGAGEAQIRRPDDGGARIHSVLKRSGKIESGVDMKRSLKKGRLYSFAVVCRCPEGRENMNRLLSTRMNIISGRFGDIP